VQIEVVLGSPQALMLSKGCLWMAEKEQRLEGEQDEGSPHFQVSALSCPPSVSLM